MYDRYTTLFGILTHSGDEAAAAIIDTLNGKVLYWDKESIVNDLM